MSTRRLDPAVELPMPDFPPVPQLFAHQVERDGDAPAIACGGRTWSYAWLAGQAARIVILLRQQGMRAGDVVAVTGPRRPELIAALLAVFTAGGVLLPVDPDLPERRRQLMAEQARARFMLSTAEDTVLSTIGPELADDRTPGAAYVFFTSGTTGTPNAVLGTHAGLSHFLVWQRDTFEVGPGDRCAQLTGLSFDVVLRDVFLPLASGAVLCLPDSGRLPTPDELVLWFERERITLVHTVPTLAQTWLSATQRQSTAPVRVVFFAGEPLSGELAERWRTAYPATRQVVNLYGPTETTLAKCAHLVEVPAPAGIQPLGRPLPQTQILVLDGGRVCEPGVPGEIVIRTPLRTLGYLNNAEATARRFVANPWGSEVLFRTGDRGRYSPDGVLEFLGRLDDQVKILGVRVQPAEVTAALLGHPEVTAGRVIPDQGGLHAFYVSETPLSPSDLRDYLRERLPTAMVPARFTAVDHLPITANGKLDRAALERMAGPREPGLPPEDPLERTLAGIWAEVLDVPAVHRNDDFFELGGHSLLAARMLSRVRKQLGVMMPLRRLLKAPSLVAFGAEVSRQLARGRRQAPTIPRLPRNPTL